MRSQLLILAAAAGALVVASVAADVDLVRLVLEPPFPVGWLFAAAAGLVGIVVLLRAMARIGPGRDDPRELIRAVRLVFVAVGLFAAAAGWIIGSALPIIAGLIIVAIDVLETTFLLLVTARRGSSPGAPPGSGAATEGDAPAR
jgi:hypothetical protein